MLFKEILDAKYKALWPQFEQLYNLVIDNQTHEGDLLLVRLNAFYNIESLKWDNLPYNNPYMFGPNVEGHAETTHYSFIGYYLKHNTSEKTYGEYLKEVEYSPERRILIDELTFSESISIQTEMLIYLKIWESDIFIKKFWQLVKLTNKEPYDWHLSVSNSSRSGNLSRDEIIRKKIRNTLKDILPGLYASLKKAYNKQLRNAIAHSQYSILGRHIQIHNYIESDPYSQIKVVSFNDWIDVFHETLAIYELYHDFLDIVNDNYGQIALTNENMFPIRVSREEPIVETQYLPVYFREFFKDWNWQPES